MMQAEPLTVISFALALSYKSSPLYGQYNKSDNHVCTSFSQDQKDKIVDRKKYKWISK